MVRLFLKEVAEIKTEAEISLLALTDELTTRMLTVVCGADLGGAIQMRMAHGDRTATYLPEVTARLMKDNGLDNYELRITGIDQGQYKSFLHDSASDRSIPIRISDGILLAQVAKLPIYIDDELMEKQSVAYRPFVRGVSVPVNIITVEMLEKSLKKAIDDEDYEMAAKLHQELENRKNDKNSIV